MFNAHLVGLSQKIASESDFYQLRDLKSLLVSVIKVGYEEVRVRIAHLGKAGATAFDESHGSRGRTSSRTNESGSEPGPPARPGLAFPIRKLGTTFLTVRNGSEVSAVAGTPRCGNSRI